MAPCNVLEVGLDLRLRRVAARPARVRGEGELVEVRGNVAGGARIGVVVPNATDTLATLEDGDIAVTGAPQHHGRSDPAEAGADHGHRAGPIPSAAVPIHARVRAHVADSTPLLNENALLLEERAVR